MTFDVDPFGQCSDIILIGPVAAGKSTLAPLLADRL